MDTAFLVLRVVVALAAVLGLIWFVQRKVARGSARNGSAGGRRAPRHAIQVLGTHRLAQKASISLVEVDGQRLVLGVTEHGIALLEPRPAPATLAAASDPTQVATQVVEPSVEQVVEQVVEPEPEPDFADILREALAEAAEPVSHAIDAPEPRRRWRRRRVSIPALGEQLLPHMTRTLAGAIGLRVAPVMPRRSEPMPASAHLAQDIPLAPPAENAPLLSAAHHVHSAPVFGTGSFAALAQSVMANDEPAPRRRNYDDAVPLHEHLPVLQRAS